MDEALLQICEFEMITDQRCMKNDILHYSMGQDICKDRRFDIYMKTVGGCVVFMDNFSDRRRMNGGR